MRVGFRSLELNLVESCYSFFMKEDSNSVEQNGVVFKGKTGLQLVLVIYIKTQSKLKGYEY